MLKSHLKAKLPPTRVSEKKQPNLLLIRTTRLLINHFETLSETLSLSDTSIAFASLLTLEEIISFAESLDAEVEGSSGPVFTSPAREVDFISPIRRT